MAEIPPRLQDPSLRFVLLGAAGEELKIPYEKGWPETANYPYTDTRLSSHRGNIGVCGGFGDLLILDSDDLPRWEELGVLDLIPSTLTIESRPGHRQFYVKCSERFPSGGLYDPERTDTNPSGKPEYVHIGDIKGVGGQAVSPGCKHPTGSIYQVVEDLPIAEVAPEHVRSILQKFRQSKKVNGNYQKLEEQATKSRKMRYEFVDPLAALRVVDIMAPAGKTSQSGDELRGDHPVHGSDNGGNYVINLAKNVWHCKRCEAGGGPAAAIAVKHGLISCSDAAPGELRGDLFRQVLKIAKEEYGMSGSGPRAEEHQGEPEETISEDELEAYSLPDGPKFECNLPKDHFIQRFMAYGADISDAYVEYWFAGGLFALAVAADKKIKVSLQQGTIYPNLYISINGKSSLARKSTVVDKTEEMLNKVLPYLLPSLVPTEFSPEAFTEHLSDYNHASWIRDEAAGVLSLMKKDYMRGFKDSLMQLFDCKPFYRKLRTSQRKSSKTEFRVDDPYLSLLWATTDASLGANTEQNDTLSGFMARFLFFFPQGKKLNWLPLQEGTAAISIFEEVVRGQLSSIADKMVALPECTALHFSPEAAGYYIEWQRKREEEWTLSGDGSAMQIHSRLVPMVTKLGMLFELGSPDFDPSKPIRQEFIEEACRLVDSYFMPTARAVYELVGANAEKNVIDRIIMHLKNHGGKASKKEIMASLKIKSADFTAYLDTMVESDVAETKTVKRCGKGRDTVYVFLLPNVSKVSNVSKIAKVSKVSKENIGKSSATLDTLDTLDTKDILACVDGGDGEPVSPPTIGHHPRKDDPGFLKFKAKVRAHDKHICRICEQRFAEPLTVGYHGGGFVCERCRRDGAPSEPAKADSQTKLADAQAT